MVLHKITYYIDFCNIIILTILFSPLYKSKYIYKIIRESSKGSKCSINLDYKFYLLNKYIALK